MATAAIPADSCPPRHWEWQYLDLMRRMVADGEVDHLVAERVWQELARGLMEPRPSRMFTVLRECAVAGKLRLKK